MFSYPALGGTTFAGMIDHDVINGVVSIMAYAEIC
jgi:hypothetical protein